MVVDVSQPPFESPEEQTRIWGRPWGCDSDVGQLEVVLMHPPHKSSLLADPLSDGRPSDLASDQADEGWYWAPGECIARDQLAFGEMMAQWENLVEVLRSEGVEVILPRTYGGGRFICYTRDPVIAVKGGMIIGRLPGATRRGEERWAVRTIAELGAPIIRTVTGAGMMEGGSFAWLNSRTVAIGRSNCVNEEGTRQVEQVLNDQGVEVVRVDLTMHDIHLDGVFTMIGVDLALVDIARVPYRFLEQLDRLGIVSIELSDEDDEWIVNSLAIRPGVVLTPEGVSAETRQRVEAAGVQLITVPFGKMHDNGGGIRCSTAPLVRRRIE